MRLGLLSEGWKIGYYVFAGYVMAIFNSFSNADLYHM